MVIIAVARRDAPTGHLHRGPGSRPSGYSAIRTLANGSSPGIHSTELSQAAHRAPGQSGSPTNTPRLP